MLLLVLRILCQCALRLLQQVDAQRFDLVREALARKYANANMSPSKHASYLRLTALKHMWPVEDALAELRQLTPSALQVGCSRCLAER